MIWNPQEGENYYKIYVIGFGTLTECNFVLHSVVQEFVLSRPSLVFLQGLSLIVAASYLPSSLCRDEPANEAVNQPLMLQRVWLSPNPPWLTLAIIQLGLQLTGYIMINRSRPGSGRICSYGNRELHSFAFFLLRSGRPLQKNPSHLTQNHWQIWGGRCSRGTTLRSVIPPIHS